MRIMSFELWFLYWKNFNSNFVYVGWGLKFGEGYLGRSLSVEEVVKV
jgi:hypothetical protein